MAFKNLISVTVKNCDASENMDGGESEAVFDSLNVNPQLFINEVLNSVDDLVDDAFSFYLQQASTSLKTDGTDKSEYLSKGVAHIRNMIQSVLDKRLGMWEKYCLHHCFAVPEGFSLPKNNEVASESCTSQDALCDTDLDMQLDSLRDKLAVVVKESAELNQELHEFEQQTSSSNCCVELTREALKLYEKNSVHDMFKEMLKTASELRTKMDSMKARRSKDLQCKVTEKMFNPGDLSTVKYCKVFDFAELDDIQDFLDEVKNK